MTISTAVPARLVQVTLTNTLSTPLYTNVTLGANIQEVIVCNTDTSDHTFTIYTGTAQAVANTLFTASPIRAKETLRFSLATHLAASDNIYGGADAGSVVSLNISGLVYS